MLRSTFYSALLVLLFSVRLAEAKNAASALSAKDGVLLAEMKHFYATYSQKVWANWNPTPTPFLYKTAGYDYLFDHPSPSAKFAKMYSQALKKTVYVRKNRDTVPVQATYEIDGAETVVMTAPGAGENACRWVLKACHELFHIYQYSQPNHLSNPFTGPYQKFNELDFPFPFQDEALLASCHIEGEYAFDLLREIRPDTNNRAVAKRVFRDIFKLQKKVFPDSLQLVYKRWQEWNEGVARYTERELAMLAIKNRQYQPLEKFSALFHSTYKDAAVKNYYQAMLNPARFVGEGLRSKVMFYYSGMVKAYVLDLLRPGWKEKYFAGDLDSLIDFP